MKRPMRIITALVLLARLMSPVSVRGDDPSYRYYRGQDTEKWDVMTFKGNVKGATFEVDSRGTLHVFAVKSAPTGGNKLFYAFGGDGEFSAQTEIFQAPGLIAYMESVIDCNDVVHLVWCDDSYSRGNIYYAAIEDGAVIDFRALHDEGKAMYPCIAADPSGNVHIQFAYRSAELDAPATGYIRIIDGIFQPLLTAQFSSHESFYRHARLCAADHGTVYFFTAKYAPKLLVFRDGEFLPPIRLSEMESGFSTDQYITYAAGKVHLLCHGDFWLIHMESSDGITFSEPERITQDGSYFKFVAPPMIADDGSIMVLMEHELLGETGVWDFYGYYQIDRGLGYGNPRHLAGLGHFSYSTVYIPPTFRPDPPDGMFLLAGMTDWNPELERTEIKLYIKNIKPTPFEEPWIEIMPPSYYPVMSPQSTTTVTLDVYNPTETRLEADLVVVTELSLARGYYLFLCDVPSYPGFREEYFGFPLTVEPGRWWQNAVIFELPMNQVDESISGFWWYWYAALVDPETGELIGNMSNNTCQYLQ